MTTLACVRIPGLRLQIAGRRVKDPVGTPLLVVEEDKPTSRVIEMNGEAARRGVRRGMRYAQALLLSSQIQAQSVSDYDVKWTAESLTALLGRYSPTVEPVWFDEGAFWCPIAGLKRLYGSFERWAEAVDAAIQELGFNDTIAVGESCVTTYVAAREATPGTYVPQAASVDHHRLDVLPLSAQDSQNLYLLGITTIGAFSQLSEQDLHSRVSRHTLALHRFVTSPRMVPLQGVPRTETFQLEVRPDPPLANAQQLLDEVVRLFEALIAKVRSVGVWVTTVTITYRDEGGREQSEFIRTAQATRDLELLARLAALRLQQTGKITDRIDYCSVRFETIEATNQQQELIQDPRTQEFHLDESRLRRTVAVLQARLGNRSVQTLEVRDDHLPERQFRSVPTSGFEFSVAARDRKMEPGERPLPVRVRRIHDAPVRQIVIGRRLHSGPFFVSTGWWDGAATERIYAYFHDSGGRLIWAYRSRGDASWFEQGYVD